MFTPFSFELPVEITDETANKSSSSSRKVIGLEDDQQQFRLLVVKDKDNNRNLLTTLLRTVGFQVQETVNGRDAIDKWRNWRPHFNRMDIRMPVMDGCEAIKEIKKESAGRDTVIIALTASAFEKIDYG